MKFALFKFPARNEFDIGETDWIVKYEHSEFSNFNLNRTKVVQVLWPDKVSNKQRRSQKSYDALILEFSGT